jgi:hypothetical protein
MPKELEPYFSKDKIKPAVKKAEKPTETSEKEAPANRLSAGAIFEFTLPSKPLSYGMGISLIECIMRCRDSGTHPLRVVLNTGEVVWGEDKGIMVSPTVFKIRAEDCGL